MITENAIKKRIVDAIERQPVKTNLKQLSLMVGRNHAYLHQYLNRGSPRTLPEGIRHRLEQLLHLDPGELSSIRHEYPMPVSDDAVAIPFLEHGSHKGGPFKPWFFPRPLFEQFGIRDPNQLKLAKSGDTSPNQMINAGDMVLMDCADHDATMAGFFAIDMGAIIRIRYLEKAPSSADAPLIMGHDHVNGYSIKDDSIPIIGRVLFHFRMIGRPS